MKSDWRLEVRQFASGRAAMLAKGVSAIALGLAVASAFVVVALRLVHSVEPNILPWALKSAFPLIFVGVAFASLQFVLPRTRLQILLGMMVAAAFVLWGAEQFVSNPAIASFIDDIVVLLFVLDLSIVIFGHLKPGARPVGNELPFDEAGE